MSGYKTARAFTGEETRWNVRKQFTYQLQITLRTMRTKLKVITNIVLCKTSHGVYGKVVKLYILIHKHILVPKEAEDVKVSRPQLLFHQHLLLLFMLGHSFGCL